MAQPQMFDRIQWHEGMLLSPQHFQQESSRVDALVGWQALAGQPTGWGVRRLEIDEAQLSAGVLRVTQVEAILPNGMAVRYQADQAQGARIELDLAPHAALLAGQGLPVYLALGSARSLRLAGQPSMFRRLDSGLVDDEVSEALAEEVPRMGPNLQLQAGAVPGAAYVHLHLMTLRKENNIVHQAPFWPAQLEIPAGAPIVRRARALAAQMRSKAVFFARQSATGSSRLEERLAMLELKAQLGSLTHNLPLLEAALQAPALQPLALYLALCAQLGPLAALRPGAVPLSAPPYVHADSYAAFDTVLCNLEELAGEVSEDWQTRTFTLDGAVFALPIRPEWMRGHLVVGLRGQDERALAQWMGGAVIGSRTVSTALSQRRVLGAPRQAIERAPELGLRAGNGFALFSIGLSDQFIVAGQDLLISNANPHHQALGPQEIVLFIEG